jgi:hypothetical protein
VAVAGGLSVAVGIAEAVAEGVTVALGEAVVVGVHMAAIVGEVVAVAAADTVAVAVTGKGRLGAVEGVRVATAAGFGAAVAVIVADRVGVSNGVSNGRVTVAGTIPLVAVATVLVAAGNVAGGSVVAVVVGGVNDGRYRLVPAVISSSSMQFTRKIKEMVVFRSTASAANVSAAVTTWSVQPAGIVQSGTSSGATVGRFCLTNTRWPTMNSWDPFRQFANRNSSTVTSNCAAKEDSESPSWIV